VQSVAPHAPDAKGEDDRPRGPFMSDARGEPDQLRDTPRFAPTGTASVSGVVLTSEGAGEPVRRAKVSLRGADPNLDYSALTDEQGRWHVGGLPAGRYIATASKPAYVPTTYGVQRPDQPPSAIVVRDGAAVTGLTVRLIRGAVIAGRVIDETGAAVPGVGVRVSRIDAVAGERRLVNVSTGAVLSVSTGAVLSGLLGLRTDDLGQYRAYGLPAGVYVVSMGTGVMGVGGSMLSMSDVRPLSAEDVRTIESPRGAPLTIGAGAGGAQPPFSPMGGRPVGYAPIFHPSAVMVDEAVQITVNAGEERGGIDIVARMVPMALARGRVVRLDGQPTAAARLSLITATAGGIASDGFSSSSVSIAPDGTFATRPLAPGRYTLSARAVPELPGAAGAAPAPISTTAMTLVADLEIDVRGDDLDGLVLTLQDGATLRGRVVFDGDSPPPAMTAIRLSLESPVPGQPWIRASGQVDADGTFTIGGVATGTYRPSVTILGGGGGAGAAGLWRLRSVRYEDRDVVDRPLHVQAGQTLENLVVTMADRMPELSGTLTDADGRPVPDLTMVLFSTNRADWSASPRRALAPQQPDSAGRFLFTNVPPGEYFLAAVSQATRSDLASRVSGGNRRISGQSGDWRARAEGAGPEGWEVNGTRPGSSSANVDAPLLNLER
jgi:hypothetical protein